VQEVSIGISERQGMKAAASPPLSSCFAAQIRDRPSGLKRASQGAIDRPVVIGFGHEMNAYGHLSASTFVAAWRHIATLFRCPRSRSAPWPRAGSAGSSWVSKEERLVLAVSAGVGSLRIAAKALPFG
jgi:hypothetical protein